MTENLFLGFLYVLITVCTMKILDLNQEITKPNPTHNPHRKHSAFLHFQKNINVMFSSWRPKKCPTK